jgi:membrane-bound lytic murein transglycosylase B
MCFSVLLSRQLKILQFIVFVSALCSYCTLFAQSVTPEQFVGQMVREHQFNYLYLSQLLEQAKVHKSIVRAVSCYRTPTKTGKRSPWYKYRGKFVNDRLISNGIAFRHKHLTVLTRAQQRFGVPAEIVTAIIGIETFYGSNTGNYRILDALYTLAFHCPRRADFFRDELKNYLLLTREERFDPLEMRGSYAGAMGLGQFMPSSYRKYAVDFDGDGRRDIWTNPSDAIGSVANYFKQHGWQSGQPVIEPTQVRPGAVESLLALDFEMKYTLQQLKNWGLLYYGSQPERSYGLLVDLETEQGMTYWVGFTNFYVITRYNKSNYYAMSVYQLAQEIARATVYGY